MEDFLAIIASLILVRPFIVLIHELGHAIPAILFTKKRVAIFVGSYGNRDKGIKFSIGLLDVFLILNPITRHPGLCSPSAKVDSTVKRVIFIAMGPVASLLLALFALLMACTINTPNSTVNFVFFILFFSSFLDFLYNIIPNNISMVLHNGSKTHNDGYHLKQLFWRTRSSKEYAKAAALYKDKKYPETLLLVERLIDYDIKNEDIYRLAISCYLKGNSNNMAQLLSNELLLRGKSNSNDYCTAGIICLRLEQNDKAIEFYTKSLALDPSNKQSLNNKGYSLNVMGRYSEAIPLFDSVIEADKTHAYSYNNRGLSKIKIGLIDEGLRDIKHSMSLDSTNAYCYLHLGIYHFDKKEYKEALSLFERAKQMDKTTYKIDEQIAKTKQLLR